MGITETGLLYVLIGLAVAVGGAITTEHTGPRLIGSFALTVPLWPIYLPFLLTRARSGAGARDANLEDRISAAEGRLIAALENLDGVAEEVLAPEVARVRKLGAGLRAMSRRAAEMGRLLAGPELSRSRAEETLADLLAQNPSDTDPRTRSVRARLTNIDRLETMRQRTLFALERALLEIEEIGSRTILLEFADRPEEEVLRMIREIADSVDVSEGALAT